MSFSRFRWRGGAFLILLALALALGVIRRFSSKQANPLLADQVVQDEDSVPVLPQRHELADQPKAEAPTESRISTPGTTSFSSWAPRTNPDAHFRIIGPEGEAIAEARVLYADSGKRGALAVPEFEWLAERHSLALVQDRLETCSSAAGGQFAIKAPGDSVSLWIDALGYDCREARFFSSDDFRHGLSTIQLGREKSMQVQLRSASGQVLKDIPVGLFRRSRVDLPEMTRISSGLSNAQGLVRLAAPLEEEPLPDCDYLAALMFPEWPLTNVFLDPFAERVIVEELQVPEFGSLQFRLAPGDVSRLRVGQLIGLRTGDMDPTHGFASDVLYVPVTADGLLQFSPIGLDLDLDFCVDSLDDFEKAWFANVSLPYVAGPTTRDEVVLFDCPQAPKRTEFRFRLLDHAGQALPGHSFEVHDGLDDDLFQVSPFSGRLDAESRGSVFVTETIDSYELEKLQNKPWYGDAVLFWKRTYDDNDSARASFKFPPRPWPDVVDLGDLLADEPPLLARGVVRDLSGKPIPFAILEWVPLAEHPGIPWQTRSEWSCDQEGRFSIGEWHDPQDCDSEIGFQKDLRLWAWAPGYQLAVHPTPTFPQDDLEIRLPAAIALEVELQLSPGVGLGVLAIEVSGPAVEAWSNRDQALRDDPDYALLRPVEDRVMTIENLKSGTLLLRAVARKNRQVVYDQLEITIPELGPGSTYRVTLDLRDDI